MAFLGRFLTVLSLALAILWPAVGFASGLVPCGTSENSQACQACHVVQLVNNVTAWLVAFLSVVVAIMIVYAGARLVTSGGNQSVMEQAKEMITNVIIGFVIVLAAWLLIDTGMKMLLVNGETALGMWNQVKCVAQPTANDPGPFVMPDNWVPPPPTDNPLDHVNIPGALEAQCPLVGRPDDQRYDCQLLVAQCHERKATPTITSRGTVVCSPPQTGGTYTGGGGYAGGDLPQCTNSYCSVTALMNAGMTASQANVMSCIAITESSGNPLTPPYNVTHPGSNSSACGLFQIVRTTWNLYNPGGTCADHASSCQNAYCNTKVALRLVQSNGYSDWTCANCNSKAAGCVAKYQ